MRDWLGLPEVASAHGADIDHIIVLIHLLMGVMFVGWLALFLYMLVRFRRKRQPVATYAGMQSHGTKWAEWAVVAAEVILLVGFSIPLWSQRVDAFPREDEAVEVRVIGEQFAWNAHYAGNDGIFGRTDPRLVNVQSNPVGLDRNDPNGKDDVVTVNQLHLPVKQPAIVHLTSKDVIHSFMLNEFRTKQDAMPGLSIPVWFEPTVTTAEMQARLGDPQFQYEIACAQLCGIGHSKMRGFLTVHAAGDFERWLDAESTKAAASESDDFWE
jgi:cytochrome c oxidase subunit II